MVPGAGLEPARCYHRGILSPLRLPISPPGHRQGVVADSVVSSLLLKLVVAKEICRYERARVELLNSDSEALDIPEPLRGRGLCVDAGNQ